MADDWRAKRDKIARDAALKVAGQTAKSGVDAVKAALGKLGEGFLSFAEGELDDAKAARGEQDSVRDKVIRDIADEKQQRTDDRADREARAREELARLKAEAASR